MIYCTSSCAIVYPYYYKSLFILMSYEIYVYVQVFFQHLGSAAELGEDRNIIKLKLYQKRYDELIEKQRKLEAQIARSTSLLKKKQSDAKTGNKSNKDPAPANSGLVRKAKDLELSKVSYVILIPLNIDLVVCIL